VQGVGGAFQGARAYKDVESLCKMGPRGSGSDGVVAARAYINAELSRTGIEVGEAPFGDSGVNLLAKCNGNKEGVIVLLGHYDTLDVPRHVGANTGASTSAIMLELARALGANRKGRSVWLVFLDGHYSPGGGDSLDSELALKGAKAFSVWCADKAHVEAAISIEGLGDCYLKAGLDADSPDWMREIIMNIAKRLQYEKHFTNSQVDRPSSATPFRKLGIPAAHLQDYSYGGSLIEHKKYWNTAEDTPDRVCPESLQAAGQLLYDATITIDKRLDYLAGK